MEEIAIILFIVIIVMAIYIYYKNATSKSKYLTFILKSDDTYEVKAKSDKSSKDEIILPSVYKGKKVTSIGDNAFYNCDTLKSIEIPDCITAIGVNAFNYCGNILYNNLKFNEYDNGLYLGNIENPYLALIQAKNREIKGCKIHENTKIIAGNAFISCEELENIEIPDKVITIGENAFFGCNELKSVKIGKNVTKIGDYAFSDCYRLKRVEFAGKVENWYKIEEEYSWYNSFVPITKVICQDGEVGLPQI